MANVVASAAKVAVATAPSTFAPATYDAVNAVPVPAAANEADTFENPGIFNTPVNVNVEPSNVKFA